MDQFIKERQTGDVTETVDSRGGNGSGVAQDDATVLTREFRVPATQTEQHHDTRHLRLQLSRAPVSARLFVSFLLCVLGFSYLTLLGSIWFDTEMKVANIIEAYSTFDPIEYVEHVFRYLFWFVGTFAITTTLFLLTRYSEKVKRIVAVVIPLGIISDVSSMWLVRYSDWFAWQLFGTGFLLASAFLAMFLAIQHDLWFKKH